MSADNCEDYKCERPNEGHTHVGVQPHLRRVISIDGILIDGKTGEPPVIEEEES